jgi:diphosphomevalonate decarboxylase
MTNHFSKIAWQSPSNIALIKYWGKHGIHLPNNASLSMTLKNAVTRTKMEYRKTENGIKVAYNFEGDRNVPFEGKVIKFLNALHAEMPFLSSYEFRFESENSFPHSTGIASSASSMSVLALCLVSLEEEVMGNRYSEPDFFKRASHIARLGSGSASRSVYGGWVTWGEAAVLPNSSDRFASPVSFSVHKKFQQLKDSVLIVSSKKKRVSSTLGHQLMDKHPFAKARYKQAADNLALLKEAMIEGDFNRFASLVELEALSLHGLLMTSSEDGLLLKPKTWAAIIKIRKFRLETGIELCFTLDAGPNVHLLYPLTEREKVLFFIRTELQMLCENEKWIDDEIGDGPTKLD